MGDYYENSIDLDESYIFEIDNKSWGTPPYDFEDDFSTTSYPHDHPCSYSLSQSPEPKKFSTSELMGRKSEDFDKYWIRKFRSYLRKNMDLLCLLSDEPFWKWFMSPQSEPKTKHMFKSYNKKYRAYLRSQPEFLRLMRNWYWEYGNNETLAKFDG